MQEVLRPLLTREDGEVIALLSMQLYVVTALEQLERDAGKFTRAARQASNPCYFPFWVALCRFVDCPFHLVGDEEGE